MIYKQKEMGKIFNFLFFKNYDNVFFYLNRINLCIFVYLIICILVNIIIFN